MNSAWCKEMAQGLRRTKAQGEVRIQDPKYSLQWGLKNSGFILLVYQNPESRLLFVNP